MPQLLTHHKCSPKRDHHELQNCSPILSIGIPTYQRLKWLGESLRLIVEQVEAEGSGAIEVVVSDNSSTDGTFEWLKDYQSVHPVVKIFRHSTNVGADLNLRGLVEKCCGHYLWLLGDDDFIMSGAIDAVLSYLRNGYDYIAVNFIPVPDESKSNRHPCWKLNNDIEVKTIKDCSEKIPNLSFGFISCWIAKRGLFNLSDLDVFNKFAPWGLTPYIDRHFTVANSKIGLIGSHPLIKSRRPSANAIDGYPNDFEFFEWFFLGTAEAVNYLQHAGIIDQPTLRLKKSSMLTQLAPKRILYERGCGKFQRAKVNAILFQKYKSYWQYWLLCLPAMYLPYLGVIVKAVKEFVEIKWRRRLV